MIPYTLFALWLAFHEEIIDAILTPICDAYWAAEYNRLIAGAQDA